MKRRGAAWPLLVLTLVGTRALADRRGPARAPRRLALTLALECPGLRPRELAHQLAMETADLPEPQLARLVLMVQCREQETRLVLTNPDTRRQVERLLPVTEAARPGAEREVALTASRLLVNSWLELFTDAPPDVEPPEPPPPRTLYVEVEKSRDLALAAHAAVTVRDLPSPLLLYGGGLRLGIGLAERLRLVVELDVGSGAATRQAGRVNAFLARAGGGVGYLVVTAGAFALDAALLVSAEYGRLEGVAAGGPYTGASASGFAADVSATVAPGLRFGVFSAWLAVCAGYAFPAMEGGVAGEAPVRLSGPWVAAALRAEVAF